MKKQLFTSIIVVLYLFSYGQKVENPLNHHFNRLIQVQTMNKLKINIPILLFTSNFFIYYNLELNNNKIYFEENNSLNKYNNNQFDLIVENEFNNAFDFSFISHSYLDTVVKIEAYSKDRLLFNLKYYNHEETQSLITKIPNFDFSQEYIYKNNKLTSTTTKRNEIYYYNTISEHNSIIQNYEYNTRDKQYQLTEERFVDGKLSSKTYYKKNRKKDARKLDKTEKLTYNEQGLLSREDLINKKGKIESSTNYYYTDNKITAIAKSKKGQQETIYFHYNEKSLLEEKDILIKNEKFKVKYSYTEEGAYKNILISKENQSESKSFDFFYNKDGRLITVYINGSNYKSGNPELLHQYRFFYSPEGNLEALKEINSQGKVTKEVFYKIDFVDTY